jgi:predicted AlkP superfamily pyrophosphatase or phosphodiesterase
VFGQLTASSEEGTLSNSKESMEKPYLILISLDGFRWDYVERFKPPHLSDFINNGAKAESLIPAFPSKTFPNHYTIATGLYPDKHGLLGNSFYDYTNDETYSIRTRETIQNGKFYKGVPIWAHAANSGMVTASYFFVGSEADIGGVRPTYYYLFDRNVTKEAKVDQVLEWLGLPEKERPHFITAYFVDMDNVGHRYGPNADKELEAALMELDEILGQLFKGVMESGLPVNIIIVSDHGMTEVPLENYIPVEKVENDDLYLTINNGSIVNIHPNSDVQIDSVYNNLKPMEQNFRVFKTKDVPYFEQSPNNKNWGSLQLLPDEGYYFMELRVIGFKKRASTKVFGQHGFDTNLKEMHGILYMNGPAFKNGHTAPSVKNIHIYPLMCEILGLDIPTDIDGKLEPLKDVLKNNNK